jgi:hypothetical protein
LKKAPEVAPRPAQPIPAFQPVQPAPIQNKQLITQSVKVNRTQPKKEEE